MRISSLFLVFLLLLSGCSSTVKTPEVALDPRPLVNISVGVALENVDTTEAMPVGEKYGNYKDDLYATLLSESKGAVSKYNAHPLRLFVSMKLQLSPPSTNFGRMMIGALSFIIIPFTFIPEPHSESYSIHYEIQDQNNNILHQKDISETIEGSFWGYYIARTEAGKDLVVKEAKFAATNAARHIIKDINDNAGRIMAASKAPGGTAPLAVNKIITPTIKSDIDELPLSKLKGRKNAYALVIGIEQYRQKLPQADFAVHDARTVTDYLTKVLGYPEENVVTLINEQASKGDFVKYIEKWLRNNVEQGGTVFVYYSGHGAPDPKTSSAYLVPYDADPSFIDETGYSLARMYDALGKLPAKEVVVALDSCFSGAGGRSVIAKGARPLVMNLQNNMVLSKNMAVLSAASGAQMSSTYDDKGHGLFTYFMLKGIKNEDVTRPDGSIKINDLFSYLKPQVERIARKQYNNEQTPQMIAPK